MASWIFTQQWLLTIVVATLILNERSTSRYIGGTMSYALWLLIPLALVVNSFPQAFSSGSTAEISRYIISLNAQSAQVGELISWQVLWLIGALTVGSLSVVSTLRNRFNHKLVPISVAALIVTLPKRLTAYHSDEVAGPMLIGVWSPKLVLPTNFNTLYNQQQQQLILEHELCHYQRRDNLVNVLVMIGLSCCWFNPIAWLGYRSFRKCQEIACDTHVLNNKSLNERIEYGRALINCAQSAQHRLCIDSNYSQRNIMFKRISMLKSHRLVNRPAQAIAAMVAGLLITSVAFAAPEPPTQTDDSVYPEIRIEPRYPIQAAKDLLNGSVVLKFDIMTDGSVMNISVVKSVPQGIFDKESRRALKQWKYKASAAGATNQHVQLDFVMSNDSPKPKNLMADIERIKVNK
ncbi:MAG: M56 family metallopeptidase [Gammaproteobacteria bacterium]|nr:M56 family metallopeptidase [Gammaproteobacteria bacterium]